MTVRFRPTNYGGPAYRVVVDGTDIGIVRERDRLWSGHRNFRGSDRPATMNDGTLWIVHRVTTRREAADVLIADAKRWGVIP